jgi:hypothetical protein
MIKSIAKITLNEFAEVYSRYETQDYQVHFKQPPQWDKVFISVKMKKGFAKFTLHEYTEVYMQYETQDYQVHFNQPP